ncbi:hypothetical protein [Pseudorhodoplanes sinuspersici]|uniref:Uncharacterized protein n=1 Tax=Pseudorhodoplanes sinuspersici TaxID=1235591 RepID=A0A1W6ZR05_9HYPH|nr:hypothetical protein [Pseudorhodoplanes sinuspersici]ARP99823.1 hypothetical protein CAK95_12580 [Pseudorhodoplanes sinuspersici]RKE70831.1 hypothetical protein DFP91_3079 [Pseudorhodoplanes sinuspersici]
MLRALLVLVSLTLATGAYAQHKHGEKGPNGGRLVEAGDYHIELFTRDGAIDVNVMDHDNKPQPTKGYKGLVILSVQGKSQRIVLEPAEPSRLSGKAEGALPADAKGVLQISPPNGKTVQARF